ncbi:MAG: hypothetical protein QXF52_11865 [Thermoproteota archaeon]
MLRSLLENKAGISSVIQAVVITAIGILIAIGVMLWLSGLTGRFAGRENIGFTSPSCYLYEDENAFRIQIRLKNAGAPMWINDIFINGVPLRNLEDVSMLWVVEGGESGNGLPIQMKTGINVDLTLIIPDGTAYSGGVFTRGVTVNIEFRSSSGSSYPTSVILP